MAQEAGKKKPYPSREDCEALWKQYGTPPHVVAHCRAVAAVAGAMAGRLNERGFHLNIALTEAAGLLHDIARTSERHWEKGAALMEQLGHPEVAEMIKQHMSYQIDSSAEQISELDLVCMADRLVKEDCYVGPEERMAYIIHKAREIPGSEQRIRASYRQVCAMKERLEKLMGISLEALLGSE